MYSRLDYICMKVARYAKHIFYGIVIILIVCAMLWYRSGTIPVAYNTDDNEGIRGDATMNVNQYKDIDVNNLPKIKCKHGKYIKLYNRDDPMHPKNRGFFSFDNTEKKTIVEGYSTGYSGLTGAYSNPNSDPNQDPGFSSSGPGSTNFNNSWDSAQGSVSEHECGKYCNSGSCCTALQEWADSQTSLINVDFEQNRYDGGNHMVYCSDGGGGSGTTADQYNSFTNGFWNSCLSNQNNMVQQKCNNMTGGTLNTYSNNVIDSGSFQNSITNAVQSGTFEYQGLGMGSDGNWDHAHYQISSVLNEMQAAWDNCDTTNRQILAQAMNDCSNPNTSITQDGNGNLQCGVSSLQQTAAVQTNKALQSATNPLVNDYANTTTLQSNLAYAQQANYNLDQLQSIQSNLSSYTSYANTVYNYCSNPNTRLDPNGVIACVPQQYQNAYSQCQAAMALAQGENDASGNTTITNFWNDLSNNLTYAINPDTGDPNNNVLSTIQSTLQNANQYCTNEINKYNSWKTDEDIASNLPCIPEQSIEPGWNSTLTGYVVDWSNAALTYLDSLNAELDGILADLSGSPQNALTLTESTIQSAPYGTLPSFTITGLPLNQTLNIVIPNGAPGPNGLDGTMPGDYGNKGNRGTQGTTGNAGIWEIPVQYSA